MKRSIIHVGMGAFLVCGVLVAYSGAAYAQKAPETAAEKMMLSLGGSIDEAPKKKEAAKAPGAEPKKASEKATKKGSEKEAQKASEKASKKEPAAALKPATPMSLEELALTEGVDITTEALDEGYFRDISRQESLTFQELFETAGALETEIPAAGEIIDGEPSSQLTFAKGDLIYINKGNANGITKGTKLGVLRVAEKVYHPISGAMLGQLVILEGVIEVTEIAEKISKAKVIKSFSSMERGDLVTPYDKPFIPSFDPDKPVSDKEVEGVIVRAKEPKKGMSKGDVVFLDVGQEQGVGVGDNFNIIDTRSVVRNDGRVVEGIPKIIGKAKVISTREKTSTAILISSQNTVYSGDKVEYSPN